MTTVLVYRIFTTIIVLVYRIFMAIVLIYLICTTIGRRVYRMGLTTSVRDFLRVSTTSGLVFLISNTPSACLILVRRHRVRLRATTGWVGNRCTHFFCWCTRDRAVRCCPSVGVAMPAVSRSISISQCQGRVGSSARMRRRSARWRSRSAMRSSMAMRARHVATCALYATCPP